MMALFDAEIGAVIRPSIDETNELMGNVPARHLPILALVAAAGTAQLRFLSGFRFHVVAGIAVTSLETGFSRATLDFRTPVA
jgi:hypothetical protein